MGGHAARAPVAGGRARGSTRPRAISASSTASVRARIEDGSRALPAARVERGDDGCHVVERPAHRVIMPAPGRRVRRAIGRRGCERRATSGRLDRPVKSPRSRPLRRRTPEEPSHAHRRHRRRRPHRRRQAQRKAVGLAPGRPRWRGAQAARRAQPARSRAHRRRDHGLRDAGGQPGPEHRPQRRARRRLPRVGARHLRRPPVRLVAAGRALRCPGRDRRRLRHRDRGRRGGHDHHADGRVDDPRLDALRSEGARPLPRHRARRASRPR